MDEPNRVLAIAAASGRVGHVFFSGGRLRHWSISRKASRNGVAAVEIVQTWINRLKPNVVVTEALGKSRKGDRSKAVTAAIGRIAAQNYLLDIAVERVRRFENKYLEARALAEEFPEIGLWLPKARRLWETEPRSAIYIDALVLAKQVIDGAPNGTNATTTSN